LDTVPVLPTTDGREIRLRRVTEPSLPDIQFPDYIEQRSFSET
jgi:hypothetical protein